MRPAFRSDTGLSRIAAPARRPDHGDVPLVDHDPHGMMQVFCLLMIGICHPLKAQLLFRRLSVVKLTRTGGSEPVQVQARSTFVPICGPSRSVCLGEEEEGPGFILTVESIIVVSLRARHAPRPRTDTRLGYLLARQMALCVTQAPNPGHDFADEAFEPCVS